jgi:hypothetical protein
LRTPHGIVRPASRPEPVAVIGKGWIEDRLEDLKQRLLDKAIQDGGNAELAKRTYTSKSMAMPGAQAEPSGSLGTEGFS